MHDFLASILLFLAAVTVAVPLFNRFKLGATLAYLAIGASLGPHGLNWLDFGSSGGSAAELGVVLLLFIIGLELSPQRLWLMRRGLLAVGLAQIVLTMAVLVVPMHLFGQGWLAAAVAALALAMSSTAIGVQLLADRKELGTDHGRNVLAVLLAQDIVAIPAIALLPLLAVGAASRDLSVGAMAMAAGKVLGAVVAVVVAGRFLVRPLFRQVAATRSTEAFSAATLLVALGTAWAVAQVGLSMTIGAFLAGLLLAESEYRHEIESHIEPFKGLLLGLFFIGVGVSVDWHYVSAHGIDVAIGVGGLTLGKILVLALVGRYIAHLSWPAAARFATLLSQGGEFAFVLLSVAATGMMIDEPTKDLLTAVIVLSMAATPLLLQGLDGQLVKLAKGEERPFDSIPEDEDPRVIIAGFGRVGQIVARVLLAHRIPFTALEQSVEQVDTSRRFGNRIFYGDPTRPELLRAARAHRAEIFVLATDDPEANIRAARLIKRLYPHLRIYARARNRQHAFRLMDLSVEYVVRETLYSSMKLAEHVLRGLGVDKQVARDRLARFKKHDERLMHEQHLVYDDETKLIQTTKEALADLEQILEADLEAEADEDAELELDERSRQPE